MWKKLKQCKTLGELYTCIGNSGTETGVFFLFCILSSLPVVMSIIYAIIRGESTYDTLYIHEGLFTACAGLILALSIFWLRHEKSKKNILQDYSFKHAPWIAMLFFLLPWSILSASFSVDKFSAFFGTDYSYDGVLSYFLYAGCFVGGLILKDETKREKLLKLFCIAADITALIVICEGWQVPVVADIFGNNGMNAGCFTNSNHAAYYLCTATAGLSGLVMETAFRNKKISFSFWLYAVSLAVQIYALYVNDTFGSMLAVYFSVCIVLPLFFLLSGKRSKGINTFAAMIPGLLLFFMVLLDACGVPLGAEGTCGTGLWKNQISMLKDIGHVLAGDESAAAAGSSRWEIWVHYFECFLEHPLLGLGPEGLEATYTIMLNYMRPHNEYLIYLSYLGLPGFLAYMGALITVCIDKIKHIRQLSPITLAIACAVVCYLFSAFFGNTKFYTYPYFWMLFGMLTGDEGKTTVSDLT